MQATLHSPPSSTSAATALARLRADAATVRDANDAGTPRNSYARCLLSVLDMLDVCYTNGHTALIRELWRTVKQTADRLSACPKLSSH